ASRVPCACAEAGEARHPAAATTAAERAMLFSARRRAYVVTRAFIVPSSRSGQAPFDRHWTPPAVLSVHVPGWGAPPPDWGLTAPDPCAYSRPAHGGSVALCGVRFPGQCPSERGRRRIARRRGHTRRVVRRPPDRAERARSPAGP